MKKIFLVSVLVLGWSSAVYADETAASEASIREFLVITNAAKLMEQSLVQGDAMIKNGLQQAIAGHPATPEQQKIIDDMQNKMMALLRDELKWEKYEPIYIDIYKQSFTQKEMNGVLAFYKSPAGRAFIVKMPVVMQHTMETLPKMMQSLMPKLQQLMRDTEKQLKAVKSN